MLNKIWPSMIILSILFGILNGRMMEVNDAIYVSFKDAVEMCINFLGVMCFWSGMVKILKHTKILDKFKKILKPVVNKFFCDETEKAKEMITLNIVSNIIGIGNAATPMGIKAMEEMDKNNNSKKLSSGMNLFLLLNTLSIQVIPTTIISIRAAQGSQNSGKIILPVWIVSILIITMLIGIRILGKEKNDECS